MAAGSQRRISHVKETAPLVAAGTTFLVDRVLGGASMDLDRSSFVSNEFRSDRAIGGHKLGVVKPRVTIPFEFNHESFDDYLESMACDSWAAAGANSAALTVTVVAGTTNTMAATGIGTGLVAGDWIKITGFVTTLVKNNGFWRVTAASANLITLGDAKDAAGASQLAAGVSGATVIVKKMAALKTGTTLKTLQVEESFLDAAVHTLAKGVVVDTFQLSMGEDSIITGSLGLLSMALDAASPAAVQYGAVYTPANERPKIDTFSGFLRIDGQVCGVVSAAELNHANAAAAYYPIFQKDAYKIGLGRANLTGSISVYLLDAAYLTKFLAETPISISLQLMEADLSRGYSIDIPKAKLNPPTKNVTENNVILTLPFQSLPDQTSGLVNWKWASLV